VLSAAAGIAMAHNPAFAAYLLSYWTSVLRLPAKLVDCKSIALTAATASFFCLPPQYGLEATIPIGIAGQKTQASAAQQAALLLAQGKSFEVAGRSADALRSYQQASTLTPLNARIWLSTGMLRGSAGDFAGARRDLQHALALEPGLAEAHYNLGLTWMGASAQVPYWKEALEEFDQVLAGQPDYGEAQSMSGVCLLEMGKPAEAAVRLRAALHLGDDTAETHFNLGRALEASGNAKEAINEYRLAIARKSAYPEAETRLGALLLADGQLAEASVHLRRALAANPNFQEAHYRLAQVMRRTGDREGAEIELRQVAALIQSKSDKVLSVHTSNESLDRAKQGDLSGALKLAQQALALDPENPIAAYNCGLLLADNSDFKGAIRELRKAISLAPLQPAFYAALSKVQVAAGETAAAETSRAIAEELQYGNASAAPGSAPGMQNSPSVPERQAKFSYGALNDTADGHLAFAKSLSEMGDHLGALGETLRAEDLSPGRLDCHMASAETLRSLGRTKAAELEYRRALLITPTDLKARLALAEVLSDEN